MPLVANAFEAIVASGHGEQVVVEFGQEGLERDLAIQVYDDGPGWPIQVAELRENILRGQPPSTKGPGRGGGLIAIDRLVHKLGGKLTLRNRRGGGALVGVVLPAEVYSN